MSGKFYINDCVYYNSGKHIYLGVIEEKLYEESYKDKLYYSKRVKLYRKINTKNLIFKSR